MNLDETRPCGDRAQIVFSRFMAVEFAHFVLQFLASAKMKLSGQVKVELEP